MTALGQQRRLFEIFDEGDDERALCEECAGDPGDDGCCLLGESELEVRLGREWRRELRQRFGDAFGLRAGKASVLEFFHDGIGVDDCFFGMATGQVGKLSQPGKPLYAIEFSNDGLITFPGGLPIVDEDGVLVGAIGVSGSAVENDHAVAEAGVKVLGVSELPAHPWRT